MSDSAIDPSITLRELVLRCPPAAELVRDLHIGLACREDSTIERACIDAGIELEEMMALVHALRTEA